MSKTLQKYSHKFALLKRGVTKYGPAPHKPVLLLAVIQGIEQGEILDNRIELTPELVGRFKSIWSSLVTTAHSPIIAQPFFHMRGEIFWHHEFNRGHENWGRTTKSCKSIGVLHQAVDYVRLDSELFALMRSPVEREVLRQTLLKRYFPDAVDSMGTNYLEEIEHQMVEETGEAYQAKILALQESLDKEGFEEEIFVRGGVFKRQVPMVYDNACCISGLKVETSINASMIDACHIVPFSVSHDDTISNGLALCPTLHRAFDRGLLAIDPDGYRIRVSHRLSEPVTSSYSIRQFEGQVIRLPENARFHPRPENLKAHLERFGDNF